MPALFFSLKEQLEQPDEIENLLSGVGESQSRVQTPDGLTMGCHPGALQEGLQDCELSAKPSLSSLHSLNLLLAHG